MRLRVAISVLLFAATPLFAQRVVDRIVAIIEDDIITQSEVRELGRYQVLASGRQGSPATSESEVLSLLIDQWIVANEARTARFPHPGESEVDRAMQHMAAQFGSPAAWQARLNELELRPATVRAILERQLWLTRYLEYKFRPAAQIDPAELEKYYREELAPRLTSNGGTVPSLASVEDQIRELLIQRDINARASRWLAESKSRLKIEVHNGGKGD
jgi:hypothetical protein